MQNVSVLHNVEQILIKKPVTSIIKLFIHLRFLSYELGFLEIDPFYRSLQFFLKVEKSTFKTVVSVCVSVYLSVCLSVFVFVCSSYNF